LNKQDYKKKKKKKQEKKTRKPPYPSWRLLDVKGIGVILLCF
jgi:hypothetical protein